MAIRVVQGPSVLLVNNLSHEIEMYARTLRAYGFHAVKAATSIAAYHIAIAQAPDIVVTDAHHARSMSGLELTRRLRTNARTTSVRIIVLTTASRRQDGELALKAGANMFLERPVSDSTLLEHVVQLFDVSRRLPRYSVGQHDSWHFAPRTPEARKASADGVVVGSRSNHHAGSAVACGEPQRAVDRTCPRCLALLEFRNRWPVLSKGVSTSDERGPRERLRYEAGWFCRNPACDYSEVVSRKR